MGEEREFFTDNCKFDVLRYLGRYLERINFLAGNSGCRVKIFVKWELTNYVFYTNVYKGNRVSFFSDESSYSNR